MVMNKINETQNSPPMIRLMRARRRIYQDAEIWQNLQIGLMVFVPALGAALGLLLSWTRPFVALAAFVATLFDVWLMDPRQKESTRLAARVTESFDCAVLELPWNEFVAGRPLDPEFVERKSSGYKGSDEKLRNWYKPPEIAEAPLPLARVICQRQNLWYNGDLRQRGGEILAGLAGCLVLGVVVVGVLADMSLVDLTVSLVAPASPVLIWSLRERTRQRDAANAIEQVKGAADAFWNAAARSGCPDEAECLRRSREFQDAIYLRRSSSVLPLPWLYGLFRPKMEVSMEAGAAERLRQIGVTVAEPEQ